MALKKTGEFFAVDGNGKRHKVIKYTEFIDSAGFQIGNEEVQGNDAYSLATGEILNKISDTEYQIAKSGVKLKPE